MVQQVDKAFDCSEISPDFIYNRIISLVRITSSFMSKVIMIIIWKCNCFLIMQNWASG